MSSYCGVCTCAFVSSEFRVRTCAFVSTECGVCTLHVRRSATDLDDSESINSADMDEVGGDAHEGELELDEVPTGPTFMARVTHSAVEKCNHPLMDSLGGAQETEVAKNP